MSNKFVICDIKEKQSIMPGPAMHYVIGQLLINPDMKLYQGKDGNGSPLRLPDHVIQQIKANPIAFNVGTLGPDFLFFNMNDWPYGMNYVADILNATTDSLISLRQKASDAFPIVNRTIDLKKSAEMTIDAGRDASADFDALVGSLEMLMDLLDLMFETVKLGIKDLVTSNVDAFGVLNNPIVACDASDEWWWFDVLHYAKSGEYAKQLMKNSLGDPQAHAYAVGYLSHVTADTVGHPYVNNVVRGPYRNHGQRHKVVENFQDVAMFRKWHKNNKQHMSPEQKKRILGEEFVNSELCRLFRYNRDVSNLPELLQLNRSDTILSQLLPDVLNVEFPDKLANLISNTAEDVYGNDFGSPLSAQEVKNAYKYWYKWFAGTTTEGLLADSLENPPPLDETIKEWFNDIMDQLKRTADAWKDVFSGGGGGGFSFNGLKNLFSKIGRALAATARLAYEILDKVRRTINEIPQRVLHFALNVFYQQLYKMYDYFRLSVSLNGFAFPAVRHLGDARVRHVVSPHLFGDANGNHLKGIFTVYPTRRNDLSPGSYFRSVPQEAHLVYPSSADDNIELEKIVAAPDTYRFKGPSYYADGPVRLNPFNIEEVMGTNKPPDQATARREQYGNARDLTAEYYRRFTDNQALPDLNLDGDRGMAAPCWTIEDCDKEKNKKGFTPNYEDPKV